MPTVPQSEWPPQDQWPKPGWKHTLEEWRWKVGDVFGWHEDGHMWTGIVEEKATCSVKVKDVLPGVMQ